MSDFKLRNVAELSRIRFKDEDLKLFETQVEQILEFVEQLKEANVEGLEPTSHPLALKDVFRDDQPVPSLAVEDFLKKAPAHHKKFFEVPKVIEENS